MRSEEWMIFRDLDLEMGVSVEHSPLRSSPLLYSVLHIFFKFS